MSENRRHDHCVTCNDYKPIKAKGNCQNCWHKYKRKYNKKFYLSTRYTEIKQRCIKGKDPTYKGMVYCTRNEFMNRFLNDKKFIALYKNWQKSGFNTKLTPSIDRIDNTKGYLISNLQFITHSENCTKDQIKCPVLVYNKNMVLIGQYESQGQASRELNIPQANIWKVLVGERKTAGKLIFKYA